MNPTRAGGRTVITPRAVSRLAARAATEIDDVNPDVKAEASINGDRVALRVRLPLIYPAPIRKRAQQARTHLQERVAALTGLTVARLDMNVTLSRDDKRRRRLQ